MADFDRQPHLLGPTLALRPLRADDFDALHAAASDPRTWAGHPEKDRHRREVFSVYFDFLVGNGSTLAVTDTAADTLIGCSGYYAPPDRPDDIGIGYTFIDSAYWGGRTNLALKTLMLDHAFAHRDEVWFHIDPTNKRSQKATMKLGAVKVYQTRFLLGLSPADWLCFRLTQAAWWSVCADRQDTAQSA